MNYEPTLKSVPLSNIGVNPYQPAQRTDRRALRGLLATIRQTNRIDPPDLIDMGDGFYVPRDGHRRIAVARELQKPSLMCLVWPLDAVRDLGLGLIEANKDQRRMGAKEYLNVWARAHATDREQVLGAISKNIARQIRLLVQYAGEDRAVQLGLEGMQSPYLACILEKVDKLFCQYRAALTTAPPRMREVMEWILRHRQQEVVKNFLNPRYGAITVASAKKLIAVIKTDVPLAAR